MDNQLKKILSQARLIALKEGIGDITIENICRKLKINKDTLLKYVKDKNEFVEKVLEYERDSFRIIFDEYDFEGVNAIDILMIVSREIARKYYDITPTISISLKEKFPKIYQDHFQKRHDFIFWKIQINLQKGISQGMYRSDLSIELVARLYMSRLIDLHNEEIFPSEKFSFSTLFDFMFDSFVRSIATSEGLEYFENKKKSADFKFK